MNRRFSSEGLITKPFISTVNNYDELPPAVCQELLQRVEEEENEDSVVYQVREDLMNRVMAGAYEKYLQKQTINFMVHCTYKALVKIIDWEFFFHMEPKPYYVGHPAWKPDDPAPPSHPDSFAGNNSAEDDE